MLGGCLMMEFNHSNRSKLQSLSSSSQIDFKKYYIKGYLHFDKPVKIEHFYKYLKNPQKINNHAFLPFIYYPMNSTKFTKVEEKNGHYIKDKKKTKRDIYYAGHKDSMIYKYYGDLLNDAYNNYALEYEIDDIATAYRNNRSGQSNIHFAKEIFQFIIQQENAYIFTMDFSKFFDRIDHKQLKRTIQKVLKVNSLPSDIYKVLKSVTQFSYIEQHDIDAYLNLKYGKKKMKIMKKHKHMKRLMNSKEFSLFKPQYIKKHRKPYGIPQGSSMSAVCANIRLIEFDEVIKTYVKKMGGIYRRYSDDLIIVLPKIADKPSEWKSIKEDIQSLVKSYKDLKIHPEKTETFIYQDGLIISKGVNTRKPLDYLGFIFNGESIKLREKSLFKYYSRSYRKAENAQKQTIRHGRKAYRKKLYQIYTHLGIDYKGYGNFITYTKKAQDLMAELPVKILIEKPVKKHWVRIQRRLN